MNIVNKYRIETSIRLPAGQDRQSNNNDDLLSSEKMQISSHFMKDLCA